jgi:hypothetical protein
MAYHAIADDNHHGFVGAAHMIIFKGNPQVYGRQTLAVSSSIIYFHM